MDIELRPVDSENWKACAELALCPEQKGFVPNNLYSIAEAQFYPDAHSLAIYTHIDGLVGYALYGKDLETQQWKVFRLMIGCHYQGRGYGEAAMRLIIAQISKRADATSINLVYQRDNYVARKLYAKLGFIERSVSESGRVVAKLNQEE